MRPSRATSRNVIVALRLQPQMTHHQVDQEVCETLTLVYRRPETQQDLVFLISGDGGSGGNGGVYAAGGDGGKFLVLH
jgi:hypothetical protein